MKRVMRFIIFEDVNKLSKVHFASSTTSYARTLKFSVRVEFHEATPPNISY